MTRAVRTVQLLGLAVAPARRARFVEEWQADLAAARSVGLSPLEIVVAAARVAGFLLRMRIRAGLARRRRSGELIARGVLLGFVLVVLDVPPQATVPFVLLVLVVRCWRWTRVWIDGGS